MYIHMQSLSVGSSISLHFSDSFSVCRILLVLGNRMQVKWKCYFIWPPLRVSEIEIYIRVSGQDAEDDPTAKAKRKRSSPLRSEFIRLWFIAPIAQLLPNSDCANVRPTLALQIYNCCHAPFLDARTPRILRVMLCDIFRRYINNEFIPQLCFNLWHFWLSSQMWLVTEGFLLAEYNILIYVIEKVKVQVSWNIS